VNPISKATSAIIHPVRTATTVAGQTLGVMAAGARTTMRIIERAAGQRRGDSPTGWSTQGPAPTSAPVDKAAATKVSPRKPAAKKAPSARAATVGPALSRTTREAIEDEELRTPSGIPAADEGHNPDTTETDLHQPGTEPLMDPATVKSARSEAEVMQRAADTDKG
jgi:hypothetical protein